MLIAFAIALGGALGALGRYGLDSLIERHTESVFPWATFTINVAGCLAVGFLIAALVDRHRAPVWLRGGLVIGFLSARSDQNISARWTNAIVFSILILVLVFRPQGLLGDRTPEKV